MQEYVLLVKWDYTYDKESTWYDTDAGEERYALQEGASYPLPHIRKKSLDIRSLTQVGEGVCAEIYTDYQTVRVCSDRAPVTVHVSDSYSVAGDSVHQSLCLAIQIEKA